MLASLVPWLSWEDVKVAESLKNLVYHQSSNTKTLRHTHTYRFYVQIPFRRNWHRVPMDGPSCCVCVCSLFPGRDSEAGGHFLLQGIFPTQGSNPRLLYLLHWQVNFFFFFNHWHHLGSLNPTEIPSNRVDTMKEGAMEKLTCRLLSLLSPPNTFAFSFLFTETWRKKFCYSNVPVIGTW